MKNTFPQGIPWNPKGVTAEEAIKDVEQAAPKPPSPHPAAASGPPPPPPPGPPPPPARFDDAPKKTAAPAQGGGLDAMFSELNKGEAVTKGLRKVNADQMTHKNPSLRAGATVPTRSDSQSSVSSISRAKSPAPNKKPKPEGMRTKKPPMKKLDGNKWIIVSLSGSLFLNHRSCFIRRIMKTNLSQSKSRRPLHIPFSSVDVTRQQSWSRGR